MTFCMVFLLVSLHVCVCGDLNLYFGHFNSIFGRVRTLIYTKIAAGALSYLHKELITCGFLGTIRKVIVCTIFSASLLNGSKTC